MHRAERVNPFHATRLFRYPLKTSENQRFPDVFRGYRKRPVAWNGLIVILINLPHAFEFHGEGTVNFICCAYLL